MSDPRPPHGPRPGPATAYPGQDSAPPLSVWATAQRDARTQRRGRYLPASTAHPAKMLPAIAATAITRYTQPGDLVADPMCGIGTTLVEAIHLGRDAIGVEYEPRWAHLAAANITCARRHGATGEAEVVRGDARQLPALLPAGRAGRVALVVTSPPYGRTVHGQVRAEKRSGGGGVHKYDNRYSDDPANLASQRPGRPARRVHPDPRRLRGAAAPRRDRRGHRPAVAAARRAGRPARRRARRRRERRPDPGRAVRGPARRAPRPAADPPPVVLPARQRPQGPRPRRALAPHRPRGRPGLPRPASPGGSRELKGPRREPRAAHTIEPADRSARAQDSRLMAPGWPTRRCRRARQALTGRAGRRLDCGHCAGSRRPGRVTSGARATAARCRARHPGGISPPARDLAIRAAPASRDPGARPPASPAGHAAVGPAPAPSARTHRPHAGARTARRPRPAARAAVACTPRGLDHPGRPERACTTPHGQAAGTDTHRPQHRGRLHGRRDQA